MPQGTRSGGEQRLLDNWLAIQGINLARHATSLRPFTKEEFGTGPAAPSEVHIEAVNRFIGGLRVQLIEMTRWVEAAATAARRDPTRRACVCCWSVNRRRAGACCMWRASGISTSTSSCSASPPSASGCARSIASRPTATRTSYIGIGTAKPTPTLLPFSYAHSGFSPATFRRGVPLRRLRHNPNLFPLIMLPQHRLDNVWALSSVLHEVSHNLQADLGLWEEIPGRTLSAAAAAMAASRPRWRRCGRAGTRR